MSAKDMTVTVIATLLSEAVAKDEQEDGCDIGAGLYGIHTSNVIREIASAFAELILKDSKEVFKCIS